MFRTFARLGVVVAALLLVLAGPAGAAAGPTLGCRVGSAPSPQLTRTCANSAPAASYVVLFGVTGLSGPATFVWSVTGDVVAVTGGCTTTSDYCTVSTYGSNRESALTATVTVTQAGQATTVRSDAYVWRYCGSYPCS